MNFDVQKLPLSMQHRLTKVLPIKPLAVTPTKESIDLKQRSTFKAQGKGPGGVKNKVNFGKTETTDLPKFSSTTI